MPGDPFYQTKQWAKIRARVKARWKRQGLPCAFCKAPIDWDARPVVDHVLSKNSHPHLAHSIENMQVVCHSCNSKKAKWIDNTNKQRINLNGLPDGW